MFDFEKFEVYQIAAKLNAKVLQFIYSNQDLDPYIKEQWKRCNLSIILNLAEGTGRMSNPDKKHFLSISRGSVFEAVTKLGTLGNLNQLDPGFYEELYSEYESVSKMLLGRYRSYNN